MGLYFLYNQYLKSIYGSLFLTQALPPKSMAEIIRIWKIIEHTHLRNYFTDAHYVLLSIVFVSGIYFFIKFKVNNYNLTSFAKISIISFTGGILYAFLMFTQFREHEYYFLDALFVPVVLIFGVFLSAIQLNFKLNLFINLSLTIIFFILILKGKEKLNNQFSIQNYDKISISIIEVLNSYKTLDSLDIPKEARLFILDSNNIANIELIHFRRKGYSFAFSIWDGNAKELILKSDYTITLNKFYNSKLDSNYRETLNKLDTFFVNENFTIYKKP